MLGLLDKVMNRRFFKRTVLVAVSLALFYYNVAWAVLRCPHQENHPDHEIVLYDFNSYSGGLSFPASSDHPVNFDCTGPKYHTEFLAGPSSTSELLRFTRDVSRGNVFVGLSSLASSQIEDDPGITLSDRVSSSASPFDLPRYLSLSVFRL